MISLRQIRIRWACSFFVVSAALLFARLGAAEEIRIIDSLGLLRASARVDGAAAVEIEIHDDAPGRTLHPESFLLEDREGVSRTLSAIGGAGGRYRFDPVPTGVWRIRVPDKEVFVNAVRVVPGTVQPEAEQPAP